MMIYDNGLFLLFLVRIHLTWLSRSASANRFSVLGKFASSSLPTHASHRGGRHWRRENTLETYRTAVNDAQTDMLEIDIWKTKDEKLVLNHDGIVNENTLEKLQQTDPDLLTLDQVLNEFSSKSSLVYFFYMKDAKAIPLTLETIKQYNFEDHVIFDAVDRSINREVQRQKPSSIPICADRDSMIKFAQAYEIGQVNGNHPYEL